MSGIALSENSSSHFRENLVSGLHGKGVILSSHIVAAFLQVPREDFVPRFFVRDPTTPRMVWSEVNTANPAYLEKVYQDEPLVTHLDTRLLPDSSSSMPSVMAVMLEALDIKPGHTILEIGTGTGYNATLLANITGDASLVTTLDLDDEMLTQAKQTIEEHRGAGMHIIKGDGFVGYPQRAPYDRIIATASVPTVPSAWIEQLRIGGKLVMDLQGSLKASGFLIVEKTPRGVTGYFLARPLYFMSLVTEKRAVPQLPSTNLAQQECLESFVLEKDHAFPSAFFDESFRWFLQWRIPGCQISKRVQHDNHFIYWLEPRGIVRLKQEETWHGSIYNTPSIWHNLQYAYQEWVEFGRPRQEMYGLEYKDHPTLVIGSVKMTL